MHRVVCVTGACLMLLGAGGRALELLALQGDPSRHPLPVAMRQRRNCDLSFAGMKSALARCARDSHTAP